MLIKRIYFTIFLYFIILCLLSCYHKPKKIYYSKLGTGSPAGFYYNTGIAIADQINITTDHHRLDVYVESTPGSVYSINALMNNYLDFCFAQSDQQHMAYNGLNKWKNNPQTKLRFICSFHKETLMLLATSDSKVISLQDIKGKKINISPMDSGTYVSAMLILEQNELYPNIDFQASYLPLSQVIKKIHEGQIDAFFYFSNHPSDAITEAVNSIKPMRIIPLTVPNDFLKLNTYYEKGIINKDLYPNISNEENIDSITTLSTLLSSTDVDEEIVYSFTKMIFENLSELKSKYPYFHNLDKNRMLEGAFIPFHQGALKYYKENGLINIY